MTKHHNIFSVPLKNCNLQIHSNIERISMTKSSLLKKINHGIVIISLKSGRITTPSLRSLLIKRVVGYNLIHCMLLRGINHPHYMLLRGCNHSYCSHSLPCRVSLLVTLSILQTLFSPPFHFSFGWKNTALLCMS